MRFLCYNRVVVLGIFFEVAIVVLLFSVFFFFFFLFWLVCKWGGMQFLPHNFNLFLARWCGVLASLLINLYKVNGIHHMLATCEL